jgi:hypothetical protein
MRVTIPGEKFKIREAQPLIPAVVAAAEEATPVAGAIRAVGGIPEGVAIPVAVIPEVGAMGLLDKGATAGGIQRRMNAWRVCFLLQVR